VGIAGVFITQPEIIILDEPFNALDPTSQLQLRQIIAQYHSQHQAITLISSHDLNHITEVSNRILLLEKGKIIHDIGVTEETPQLLRQYFENRIDVV
jgi:ABC-2 type transport system ATP-binding protein